MDNSPITKVIINSGEEIGFSETPVRMAFFFEDGSPYSFYIPPSEQLVTDLDLEGAVAEPITAEDTVTQAFAKLQAQIDAL